MATSKAAPKSPKAAQPKPKAAQPKPKARPKAQPKPAEAELNDARIAMVDANARLEECQRHLRSAWAYNSADERRERVVEAEASLKQAMVESTEASALFHSLQKSSRRSAHA